MDKKPFSTHGTHAASDLIEVQRTLSGAAAFSIEAYRERTGFTLDCLVAGAWSHLLASFAQAESIEIVLPSNNANGYPANACQIPTAVEASVNEWLKTVAQALETAVPLSAEAHTDSAPARGAIQALAAVRSILICGDASTAALPDYGYKNRLIVRASENSSLSISVTANHDEFSRETIAMLADCLVFLLEQIPQFESRRVFELMLVPDRVRAQYLPAPQQFEKVTSAALVNKAIEEQCRRHPENVAAVFNDEQITYGELDARSTRLARHLKYLGAGPDIPVAAHFGRSIDLLIALLGIMRSGAAFIPLDSMLPGGRVESVMKSSGARIAITSSKLAARFDHGNVHVISLDAADADWESESDVPFDAYIEPAHLAYVTYTSGSTGAPKGVMIEHGHLAAFFNAFDEILGRTPGVWLAVAGVSFDISIVELLWTLSRGFKVVLHEGDEGLPLMTGRHSALAQVIRHEVTHMQGTPTLVRMLTQDREAATAFSRIQKIAVGGEALPHDLACELAALIPGDVYNAYGPTETTICATAQLLRNVGETVPIGSALKNTVVRVLDKWGRELPPLAPGELFIGGQSVARGYMGRPDLTAERFIVDPFDPNGGRLYRTGDLVYFNMDGALEFIDRMDSQVKISGYRIELGEIEMVLQKHEKVSQAVVAVRDEASGAKSLAAFVAAVAGDAPAATELRKYLQASLPGYMVPPNIVCVDKFPITPNGKVDRKALLAIERSRLSEVQTGTAPAESSADVSCADVTDLSGLELTLSAWCREILGHPTVDPTDDFFEVGGNSLAAVQLMNRIAREYGIRLKLSALLHARSMRALAAELHNPAEDKPAWTPVVPLQTQGSEAPVFLIAGLGGNVLNFEPVSHAFHNRPVYGVETYGLDKNGNTLTSVEEMARIYLEEVRRVQPKGPYYIAGYSFGGILAFEMAQQLREAGEEIGLLGLIDTVEWQYHQNTIACLPFVERMKFFYGDTLKQVLLGPDRAQVLSKRFKASLDHYRLSVTHALGREPKQAAATVEHRNYYALTHYRPQAFAGTLHLFRCPDKSAVRGGDPLLGWGSLAERVAVVDVPGQHETVLSEPFVNMFTHEFHTAISGAAAERQTQHRSKPSCLVPAVPAF